MTRRGTLFIGDVHGCAEPLFDLLDLVRPERVVLLGDLFTKGPAPREVYAIIRGWQAEAVLGNHDVDLLNAWPARGPLPSRARDWLASCPFSLRGDGWVAVHAGIDPNRGVQRIRKRDAIGLRTWRPHKGALALPWWASWRGPDLVIHGHDARRGLLDRRPYTLGLDTGCFRTGLLTGYLLEANELVSVQAPAVAAVG